MRSYIRHDILQLKATIVPDPERETLGNVLAECSHWSKEEAEAQTLSLCAGYGAMVAAGYPADQAEAGSWDDFEKAEEIIKFWLLGTLPEWQAKAVEFMRRSENVRAVELIATHLIEHGTLGGGYMDVLVSLADGETTEAEWQEYLRFRLQTGRSSPADSGWLRAGR